jgi:hypothetical protein
MDRMMFSGEDATCLLVTAEYEPHPGGQKIKKGWRRLPPPLEFELSYLFSLF